MDAIRSFVHAAACAGASAVSQVLGPQPETSGRIAGCFSDPLGPGREFPELPAERRTAGDLEELIGRTFGGRYPGTTRLIDAFLMEARVMQRSARRGHAECGQNLIAAMGSLYWQDLQHSPWNQPFFAVDVMSEDDDLTIVAVSLRFLPVGNSLGDLFHDLVVAHRGRLGAPIDLSVGGRPDKIKRQLKSYTQTACWFLQTGGGNRRLVDADYAQVEFDAALKEYSALILPHLERIERQLNAPLFDVLQLHRELVQLLESYGRYPMTLPHLTLRGAADNAYLHTSPEGCRGMCRSLGVCSGLLDAPLHALLMEGLHFTCHQALTVEGCDEGRFSKGMACVAQRMRLLAEEMEEIQRSGDLALLPEGVTLSSESIRLARLWGDGLEERWEVASTHPQHRLLLMALVCRDAFAAGFGVGGDSRKNESIAGHRSTLGLEDRRKLEKLLASFELMDQGARGSVMIMEKLIESAFSERDRRAEENAQRLSAASGGRRRRRSRPAAAAPAPPSSPPPVTLEPPQAPLIAPAVEKVDIAGLHSLVGRLKGSGYAGAMRGGLSHCLVQLRERLGSRKGSVRDEVHLLRQAIEFSLRYAMEKSDLDPKSQGSHNLAPLAQSLSPLDRVGDVVRLHSEIILTLAHGNVCAHYTSRSRRLFGDGRSRWLIELVEGKSPSERETLVTGTFHFIHDLLHVMTDPKFTLEAAPEVDFQVETLSDDEGVAAMAEPAAAASGEAPLESVTSYSEAMGAIASMRRWIQMHRAMPGSIHRSESLSDALIAIEELDARLRDFTRLNRPSDSCWGELDWAHRLVKGLLTAALQQHDPAMGYCPENNPRTLAAGLPSAPPMPHWIGMVHGTVSFPVKADGTRWVGPLPDRLYRADDETGVHDPHFVPTFEKEFLFPIIDVAWRVARREFVVRPQ